MQIHVLILYKNEKEGELVVVESVAMGAFL